MKVVEEDPRISVMEGAWSAESVMMEVVAAGQEEPFYVMDLGEVVARYHQWKELMPRVEPFYAVKCNDDKVLVRTLAALGAGFDCASKAEIQLVTDMGVTPERIIFANPAKMASHIKFAGSRGVTTMTFDSETELLKIKQIMPHAQLVIRIRCDAERAQCPLGIKFGCDPVTEAPRLLKYAAVLGLQVIGVSFHVGSGASETGVYARAIQYCRALFALGTALGHRMALLDLGGGFPGGSGTNIAPVAHVINTSLETHFSDRRVRVIAEPGRYFAAAAYTLCAMVHAKRELARKDVKLELAEGMDVSMDSDEGAGSDPASHTMYFINDGVYGSFNCVLYDHQHVAAQPLTGTSPSDKLLPCSIWGPSCDGLDCVINMTSLRALAVGEWLVFKDMGAYTIPVASPFNGFPVPTVRYVLSDKLWGKFKEMWPQESQFAVGLPPSPPASLPPSPSRSPPPSPSPSPTPSLSPPRDVTQLHAVFVECALK